ncbi:MAG TPA: hypothetical protein VEI02_12900 [Planctomycetota bacterium]|nr:hypothetical protein [Planctomycetota bacterium]
MLRMMFGNLGSLCAPDQFALARAHEAFELDGSLKDAKARQSVERVARATAELARKIVAA